MRFFSFFISSLVITTFMATNMARAEERADVTLKPVTVTAQKREENIQDVPLSMNVLTGMDIDDSGATDVQDMVRMTPNVYSSPYSDIKSVTIRGISTLPYSINTGAGLFINDIPLSLNRMQNPDLMNVERVEVLRGPQGTLYGKNTQSGAINIITRQPDNENRGTAWGEFGAYDTGHGTIPLYRAGASFSGPIQDDKWYWGAAVQAKASDGYRRNTEKDDNGASEYTNLNGQVTLRWTPSSDWDVSLFTSILSNDHGIGEYRAIKGPYARDRHKIAWDGKNDWTEESNSQALRAQYKTKNFDVLSITTRMDYRAEVRNDGDMFPADLFGNQYFLNDIISYTQEFRLSSPAESTPLTWVGGVFGSTEEITSKSESPRMFSSRGTDINRSSLAAFGQATYTVFERLHLTLGARLEHQELEGKQKNLFPSPTRYSHSTTNNEFLPKATIAYDITDNSMAYATYSQGFLTGGYDVSFGNDADDIYYKPEHTTNYEIGCKNTFWGDRLILNAAVFYIEIEDKQVIEWPAGAPVTARDVTNADKASSKGFELELQARPTAGFDVFAGFGYAKATFEDWTVPTPGGGQKDYKGNFLTHAPEYTYNIGAQYRIENGLFFRADLLGTGRYYSDAENKSKVDGYKTVNLRTGYEMDDMDIVLWADNLFDEAFIVDKYAFMGTEIVKDGTPRSFGLTLKYRF